MINLLALVGVLGVVEASSTRMAVGENTASGRKKMKPLSSFAFVAVMSVVEASSTRMAFGENVNSGRSLREGSNGNPFAQCNGAKDCSESLTVPVPFGTGTPSS